MDYVRIPTKRSRGDSGKAVAVVSGLDLSNHSVKEWTHLDLSMVPNADTVVRPLDSIIVEDSWLI